MNRTLYIFQLWNDSTREGQSPDSEPQPPQNCEVSVLNRCSTVPPPTVHHFLLAFVRKLGIISHYDVVQFDTTAIQDNTNPSVNEHYNVYNADFDKLVSVTHAHSDACPLLCTVLVHAEIERWVCLNTLFYINSIYH